MIQRLEFVLETIASPDFGEYVRYEDHRAAVRELVEALREARHALQFANDSPGGPISDTIWMMHRPETLFDFLDAAIAKHQEGEG